MSYSRAPLALCIALACNPGTGAETSGSSTDLTATGTTNEPNTGDTTNEPTTGGSTTLEPTGGTGTGTGTGTGDDTSSTGDDSTTGGEPLLCGDHPGFSAAWATWQQTVEQKGDTYYYTVLRSGAGFIEPDFCVHRTTVVVTDGQVSERRFEVSGVNGMPTCEEPFIETGDQVGTHTSEYLADAVTIDTLHTACCNEVIHIEPAEEYSVEFNTDRSGLMKECYYVTNACADDCSSGPLGDVLSFESIVFGPPPAP